MKKIINLTPHEVTVIISDDYNIVIPPAGTVARVAQSEVLCGFITTQYGELPLYEREFGEVMDLPDEEGDTLFIVSTLVKVACPTRHDLLAVSGQIRHPNNRSWIIGCQGFTKT